MLKHNKGVQFIETLSKPPYCNEGCMCMEDEHCGAQGFCKKPFFSVPGYVILRFKTLFQNTNKIAMIFKIHK